MGELINLILQMTDPVTALLLLGVVALVPRIRQDLHEDLRTICGRVRWVEDRVVATDGGVEEDGDGR